MEVAALVLGLAAANLVLKANGRFAWVLADSYTHFYVANRFRRARTWRVRLDRFLYDAAVPAHLDYPPLFGTLLALLLGSGSPTRRAWLARWLPPTLDTASLLTAVLCACWLAGDTLTPLVTAFIWVLSPCTHAQTLALSGRPLGTLLATIVFSGLAKYASDGSLEAVAITFVAGAMLFLTNRLAVQAWALVTIVFAGAFHSLAPVMLIAGGLLLASAISAGHAWRVHRGHWRHMSRLRRLMPRKGWHQLARVSAVRAAPPRASQRRTLLRALTFIDLPFVWVLLVGLMGTAGTLNADPIVRACGLWLGTLLLSGAIIQAIPAIRFIGEGFRYFEFAIVPLAVIMARLVVVAGPETRMAMGVAAVLVSIIAIVQARRTSRASFRDGTRRDERAVALAQRLRAQKIDRLLVIPLQYASMLVVEADKSVLTMLNEAASDLSEDFYPVMEREPAAYVSRFALGGVWLDRRYADPEELELVGLSLVDQEGPFACYALPVARGSHDDRCSSVRYTTGSPYRPLPIASIPG